MLLDVLASFLGKQLQRPPVFSAKRVDGVRMYDLARAVQGRPLDLQTPGVKELSPLLKRVITRESRTVSSQLGTQGQEEDSYTVPLFAGRELSNDALPTFQHGLQQGCRLQRELFEKLRALNKPCEIEIFGLNLVDPDLFQLPFFSIEVTCSKGTYIRQLAADIAARCGTVGHLTELTRIRQGPFGINDCVKLADLTVERLRRHILPMQVVNRLLPARANPKDTQLNVAHPIGGEDLTTETV
ncbi:trna pseudouridine synthase b [Cystoisospora suis]|uniref:tRNA pseudouridine(55) synthase n=1 Tax=Cystoisospora suis TaxID=483139 RepID=A0A2C6KEF0_9APIC|nr:trna pseudouridine synthase b [Cystoisospora suis]